MSFSPEVIQRATDALDQRRTARQSEQRLLQAEIYENIPRLRAIDQQLHANMVRLAAAALDSGSDVSAAVEDVRMASKALQAERGQLLSYHGYAEDCLDDKPYCAKCGDRGWIGAQMCSCLRDLCAKEQIDQLSSLLNLGDQSFETFSLDWYSPEPDPDLGISPRENMQQVRKICYNYADKFGRFVIQNLFLSGPPGLGKTFLSACIARTVSEKGFSVVYDTAVNIFAQFEAEKFTRDADASAAARRYLNCDLLILDDLGSEMLSPFVQSALYTLVNARLVGEKHTVISSNLTMLEIRTRYQPMIASRLDGEYRTLPFFGEDIRLQQKNAL